MMFKKTFIVFVILMTFGSGSARALRFAVVGDTQGSGDLAVSEDGFTNVVDLVLAADPQPEFVIVVGDLIKTEDWNPLVFEDFMLWRQIASPWYESDFVGLKVYPVPGNHDQPDITNALPHWQRAFAELPDNGPFYEKKMTYSFDHGQCHFAIVNTSDPGLTRKHAVDNDWLENDLANSDKDIRFVFGHEPAYPEGRHIGESLDARPEKRDLFWEILSANNVSTYLCGHEHIYDHWIKDNVHQIICGSGGVPAIKINYLIIDVADDNSILVSVYDASDNSLMDQFDLADTLEVACEERTSEGDPFFVFIDNLPCLWTIILPTLLLALGLRLIRYDV